MSTSILSDVVNLDHILSLSIACCSCFCTRPTQKITSSAPQSFFTLQAAAREPKWRRNSRRRPMLFMDSKASEIGTYSISVSINLPDISGIIEKNCGQETFAGPSFVIAARQASASMRSDTLVLPESIDNPLPSLKWTNLALFLHVQKDHKHSWGN